MKKVIPGRKISAHEIEEIAVTQRMFAARRASGDARASAMLAALWYERPKGGKKKERCL